MLALAAFDGKVVVDSCFAARASPRTLFRWVKRLRDEGHFRPREHSGGPARKMDEDDALFLWCWTMAFPAVMRDEAAMALQMFRSVTVSLPTTSREWKRLGLSRGVMAWYSALRREPSRIAWWCNPPDPALNAKENRGIAGVCHADLVCLDESIWCYDMRQRRYGHAPVGERACCAGLGRTDVPLGSFHVLTAMDMCVGSVATLVWQGPINHEVSCCISLAPCTKHKHLRRAVMWNSLILIEIITDYKNSVIIYCH